MKPVLAFVLLVADSFHRDSKGLDQLAVLHAGRTGCLTGTTVKAQLQVAADFMRQLEPSVGDAAHQIDAAAGRIVFVARFDISWAGRRAQPPMAAVEKQLKGASVAGLRAARNFGLVPRMERLAGGQV